MRIVREEIFGPVGVIIKFEDADGSSLSPSQFFPRLPTEPTDVIRQANDTVYGLAAAIFTQDINRALETAARLKAGTAWINCVNTLNAQVPFGGFKQSGSTSFLLLFARGSLLIVVPFSWKGAG